MSRATMMMICMLATTLAVSVPCPAQAPRVLAQKLCDQLDQAYANHDLNLVLSFFDSSYVGTDERGKRVAFAELRKQFEQSFAMARHINPRTVVEDVQLQADRIVVYSKTESHYEWHDERDGWMPVSRKTSGEATWERKGGQWKLVRVTTYRADAQVDPSWLEDRKARAEARIRAAEAASRVDEALGGRPPHSH